MPFLRLKQKLIWIHILKSLKCFFGISSLEKLSYWNIIKENANFLQISTFQCKLSEQFLSIIETKKRNFDLADSIVAATSIVIFLLLPYTKCRTKVFAIKHDTKRPQQIESSRKNFSKVKTHVGKNIGITLKLPEWYRE